MDRIKIVEHDDESQTHVEICTVCGEQTDVWGCGAEECAAAAGDEDAAGRPIPGEVEYDRAKAAFSRESR